MNNQNKFFPRFRVIAGVLLVSVFLLASCNSREEQEKQADKRLKHIELLIKQKSLNAARIEIDSIHALFPRLVNKRRQAQALKDIIDQQESERTLMYCNRVLPLKQHEADSLQRNFRFEKDAKYQNVGSYIYKTQELLSNVNRCYIKASVDENAEFYLVSNYTGGKIEHVSVRVSAGNTSAQTDTIATSRDANYTFTDGGVRWEIVTFKNKEDKGVAAFIADNATSRIKVELLGKRNYSYILSDGDKKAIVVTYNLWVVKKDILKLQKEIKKASLKIKRLKEANS